MNIPLQDYFGDLKQKTLYIAEIKNITPADCYHLSLKIEEKTQKRISETTLKRVFGFAATCYKSSAYTCNALAEYCGFESYNSFISTKEKEGLESPEYKPWAVILENAHRVSRFRIESNRHRSGISYNFAIQRSQINQILEKFTLSKTTAGVITAPAGGGKTVGLTKWVDQNINQRSRTSKKNIYLFIKTSTLLSSSTFSFHGIHWLGYLLGLEKGEHLYEFIASYKDSAPGTFYLIIDDMSRSYINDKQYHSIFCQLIEMINYFSSFSWFKVVLSTRPHVWNKNKYLIEENENSRRQWFSKAIGIEGFNKQEIQQLSSNLNLKKCIETPFNDELSIIQLPLYFQLYYQLKKEQTPLKKPNEFDEFNIFRAYLNKYVLNGIYFNEKKILLNKLSRYVYYKNNTLCIDQFKTISICNQFPKTYEELLNSGILHLYSNTIGSRKVSEIRFQSTFLGSYFLALRFLQKNRNVFNENLIQLINKSYYHDSVKIELLKWLIIFAIESLNLDLLNHLDSVDFIKPNELEIVLFTIHSLENLLNDCAINEFNNKISTLKFMDFALLHLPINSEHQPILENLLKYKLSYNHQILIHSALAIGAFTCLRDDIMFSHLTKLKSIDSNAYSNFCINPCVQIEALYYYFKYGTFSTSALQEITSFNFHNYIHNNQVSHPLIFSIAFLVSNLSSSTTKPLRFLRAMQRYGMLNNMSATNEYNDFIQLMRALELIKNDRLEKAESIQFASPLTLNNKPSIQILYSIYKINLATLKQESILRYVEEAIDIAKKYNFLFSEAFIRLHCIEILATDPYSSKLIIEHDKALKTLFKKSTFRLESFKNMVKQHSLPFVC